MMTDERDFALTALSCPYYNGGQGCGGGCIEEPLCQTEQPLGGWQVPVPFGMHVVQEIRDDIQADIDRQNLESWLRAEQRYIERPILENHYTNGYTSPNMKTGVYPINPLSSLYTQGVRFAAYYETDGGSSTSWHTSREEAEEDVLHSQARTRQFWEEKVDWKEGGDRVGPRYVTIHGTTRQKKVDNGGAPVVRVNGQHYVPSYLGIRKSRDPLVTSCKGFGGAVYRWRYLADGPDGEVYETNSMFTQGKIPDEFRDRLPDNAEWIH